jgi:hypothetical protein
MAEGEQNTTMEGLDGDLRNEPVVKFYLQLAKVRGDDRSVVLVTSGFLELLVETLIKAECKNAKRITEDNRGYPYSAKLLILNEVGVIRDASFAALDWLRRLRNRAAHDPFFSVTSQDFQQINKEPRDLYELCLSIVGVFWKTHVDVLLPVFAPIFAEAAKAGQKRQR